jgi:hypothetical protein
MGMFNQKTILANQADILKFKNVKTNCTIAFIDCKQPGCLAQRIKLKFIIQP